MTRISLDTYQSMVKETVVYPPDNALLYTALGLAGESGEVANVVKKVVRDDGGEPTFNRKVAIIDELGDVVWYVTALAAELGYSLEQVLDRNRKKLQHRKLNNQLHGR